METTVAKRAKKTAKGKPPSSGAARRARKAPKARVRMVHDPRLAAAERQIPITARDRLAGKWFEKLVALQAKLRGPGGCPWDREQTHETLRKFLIEETYEALDAMDSGDAKKFASEMGDLLLQVVFHAILAEETGAFGMADVIESVHSKMIRRHPHVFGDAKADTSAAVLKNWEQIKAEERAGETKSASGSAATKAATADAESVLAGVPKTLPAVLEAYQLTRRASHIGFDWESLDGVLEKMSEESRELLAETKGGSGNRQARLEEEVGDLLFAAVNVARFVGVDPEIALKKANRKFQQRFTWMESAARKVGRRLADVPRARMEELWNESKRQA
jgi:MazG family protein